MSAARRHWGIVGGGMLGLTLAWRLVQAGQRVTVLEAADTPGGLASPWSIGGVEWDRYYHVIAGGDTALCSLLAELDLERAIAWRTTRTNFYDGRTLRPLNHALDYLRLPGLGVVDKLRLARTILRAAAVADARPLEALTAQQWLTQQGGARNWQVLWRPLLRAKLGANAEHASASYIVSVIRRFYGARQGAAKTERFGTVAGGYRQVLDGLVQALRAAGADLRCGWPVQAVRSAGGGFHVQGAGQVLACDRAVLTCASPLAAAIAPQLQAAELARLRALRYQGIVCVSLLLSRPLGGAYLTYITDDAVPFTTVIEMSTLVDPARFGGRHLVYLPRYVPVDDRIFERDDADVTAECIAGLRRLFPDLRDEEVLASRVARTRHVLAIATLHYSDGVPPLDTSLPGLHVVNSSQIVNAALSVEDTVRLADASARRLLAA